MLGLGNSICANHYPVGGFAPDQIANLSLWLPFNTGISADQDSGASSISRSTTAGDMVDEDKINRWADSSGNNNHATQTTQADKPLWASNASGSQSVNVPGGCHFPSKHLDISNIQISANTDFTFVVRFHIPTASDFSQKAFAGADGDNFIRVNNSSTIRARINANNVTYNAGSGNALAKDTDYTLIVVRSGGSTGTVNMFVKGGAHTSSTGTDWGAADGTIETFPDQFDIDEIGSKGDGSNEFGGVIKDVLIYDGTAVTSSERELLFSYIEGQTDPY